MKKAIAVINSEGLLSNVAGAASESDVRYAKFAGRLIGANGTVATLNYGWNGAHKLSINDNGAKGQLITLDAQSVVVSGELKIGSQTLQDIINSCTDLAIRGIEGTESEITVNISENDTPGEPRLSCVIGLSPIVLNRIAEVEETLKDLFRFEEVYRIGKGLEVERADNQNRLHVKLGTGLRFEYEDSSSSGSDDTDAAVGLDLDESPMPGSRKPVTSEGIYWAIQAGGTYAYYYVNIDATTGNMVLCHRQPSSSSSDSSNSSSSEYSSSGEE